MKSVDEPDPVVIVSSNPPTKRTREEAYWRKMCERNDFNWLVDNAMWSWTWINKEEREKDKVITHEKDIEKRIATGNAFVFLDKPAIWIEDQKKRGFIMLREPDNNDRPEYDFDVELYAALVDEEHRRKGVLRSMFNQVLKAYPNKKIFLFYMEDSEIVWRHLGFAKAYYGPTPAAGVGLAYDGRNRKTYFFRQREKKE